MKRNNRFSKRLGRSIKWLCGGIIRTMPTEALHRRPVFICRTVINAGQSPSSSFGLTGCPFEEPAMSAGLRKERFDSV